LILKMSSMIFSVHRALKASVKVSFHLLLAHSHCPNGQWLHIPVQRLSARIVTS
jgi:hypothetical protein